MSQQVKYLDNVNVAYILGLIRDIVNQPTIIDDTNLQTVSTFSSVKIDSLLTTLKTDLQNDYRTMINNLTHLNKEVVTTLPTTNIDENTLYLIEDTTDPSNPFFSQYLYINSQWEMIGTTKSSGEGISIYDGNGKAYDVNDVVLYKGTTDTYYSIYICTTAHTSTTTFDATKWSVVDEKQEFMKIDSAQPSNTNVFWVDTTNTAKPVLKFHDGTNWVSISGGTGSGISQYADYSTLPLASQGSPSSDLVDNKFVFVNNDYVDATTGDKYPKGFYKYISATDEWEVVYKFDFEEGVKQLKNYIQEANLRTYTGEELDYGYYNLSYNQAISLNDYIKFDDTLNASDGIQLDTSTGIFTLQPNRTYRFTANIRIVADSTSSNDGFARFDVFDVDNNISIEQYAVIATTAKSNNYSYNGNLDVIVKTTETSNKFAIKMTMQSNMKEILNTSNIIIEELHRQVIIDPSQLCEEQKGIEAVPVGDIRDFVGTKAPTHYLFADGQEYNIADYPYLAQHILDNYGSVNAFGGDGTTTFNVPNKMGSNITWYDITMTSDTTPSPYEATAHTEYASYKAFCVFDNNASTFWHNQYQLGLPTWIQIDFGTQRPISALKILPRVNNATQAPKNFTFQGSNDGINFDIISSYTNQTSWTSGTYKTFNLSNVVNYRYYRIHITASNSTNYAVTMGQIKFGICDVKLIKAEPSYYINNGTIGDSYSTAPIGSIFPYGGTVSPNGYLLCNGQEVSRSEYADLFDVISTTYGSGDGSTTFNVPDLRDRFPQGANGNIGAIKDAGLPNITGSLKTYDYKTGTATGAFTREVGNANESFMADSTSNQPYVHYDLDASLSSSIYGNSDTVQPPAVCLNYIIKSKHINEGLDEGVSQDIKDYADTKVSKTSIVTALDNTCTDEQVASAKVTNTVKTTADSALLKINTHLKDPYKIETVSFDRDAISADSYLQVAIPYEVPSGYYVINFMVAHNGHKDVYIFGQYPTNIKGSISFIIQFANKATYEIPSQTGLSLNVFLAKA